MLPLNPTMPAAAAPQVADSLAGTGEGGAENGGFSSILARLDDAGSAHLATDTGLSDDPAGQASAEPDPALLPATGNFLPDAVAVPLATALPQALDLSGPSPAELTAPGGRPAAVAGQITPAMPDLTATQAMAPKDGAAGDMRRQLSAPRNAVTLRLSTEQPIESVAAVSGEAELAPAGPQAQGTSTGPFTLLAGPQSATGGQPQAAALPASAATDRPQDFGQLIDRLVAARDASQPQAVTIALAHAEFGKVELRFGNDPDGLSVAMSSADPDFARAVQAAVPPATASTDAGSPQSRAQGGGQGLNHASDQPGHQPGNHREDQPHSPTGPHRATTPNRDRQDRRDQGIFA